MVNFKCINDNLGSLLCMKNPLATVLCIKIPQIIPKVQLNIINLFPSGIYKELVHVNKNYSPDEVMN